MGHANCRNKKNGKPSCKRGDRCKAFLAYLKSSGKADEFKRMQDQVSDFNEHKRIKEAQNAAYKRDLDALLSGRRNCVVVMDFSPWKRRFDREVSMSDWFDVLQALHICVITRDANGELCYEYFDYFSEASNNYQFVMKAMKEFFATETMTAFKSSEINLWSDGGPHHFKINTSIYFMLIDVLYDFGIRVTWKFFASNHGKGACDVHTGTCKRAARKYALTHILDGTGDIANFVNEYVKNAQAWSLSKGDVTKEKLNIARRLESVKKWHFFGLEDAVGHGKCYRIRTRQTDEPEADEMIQTITAGDEASD
eukprot:TRINITY_DN4889_c0_g1_i4.p1 TRINITY_DN4889_c0_g1~~TRINITY_DN4889_c0_g1_i4.p1  ORF type:complete len:310 (+),score=67.20 TRINITY_DN4889_c0_g1_i4:1499-2428(+)